METTTKKITLATIKAFIRKNRAALMIRTLSHYDGMVDGVRDTGEREFVPALPGRDNSNELGVHGAWFVGGSRNYFEAFESDTHVGYEVSNCCGDFQLVIAK